MNRERVKPIVFSFYLLLDFVGAAAQQSEEKNKGVVTRERIDKKTPTRGLCKRIDLKRNA
jgi:hypothetical protein